MEHQRGWVFSKTLVTICWYRRRKHSVSYHCTSDDNSARLQPTHYNHYFKEGKRPMAHILSLPLYPVTERCKQTKTTVVNMKCSTVRKTKECYDNKNRNDMNKYPNLFVMWQYISAILQIFGIFIKKTQPFYPVYDYQPTFTGMNGCDLALCFCNQCVLFKLK